MQQEPSESLNPRMSIRDALREAGVPSDPGWLERIRIPREWIDRPTRQLSEGQRARVAILRAAAALQNGLLILDESLSGLDPATRGHILSFLCQMQQDRKLSLLLVTHDTDFLADLNVRSIRMSEGRIAQDAAAS